METTIVYWGYIGILENGNYHNIQIGHIMGLYWDNGQ